MGRRGYVVRFASGVGAGSTFCALVATAVPSPSPSTSASPSPGMALPSLCCHAQRTPSAFRSSACVIPFPAAPHACTEHDPEEPSHVVFPQPPEPSRKELSSQECGRAQQRGAGQS